MREPFDLMLSRMKDTARSKSNAALEDTQFAQSLADSDEIPLPVACAFLLTDMAMIDGHFDKTEYDFIFNRLEGPLGLKPDEAASLVLQAKTTIAAGRGSSSYADYVKQHFSVEQRQQAYEMLKTMVLADGKQDDYEVFLQNRLAVSLGLPADASVKSIAPKEE